ncbi:MAG: hypothetical protein R3F34_02035 [Planctomycetota bacterium]
MLDDDGRASAAIKLALGRGSGSTGSGSQHAFMLLNPVDFASNNVELVLTN